MQFRITGLSMVALALCAAWPTTVAACSIQVEDLTNYSLITGTTLEDVRHPFRFRATASGDVRPGQISMYTSTLPGGSWSLINSVESQTDTSKTVFFFCPGAQPFQVIAEAVCSDGNGTYHQLPIEYTNQQPHVSITDIQRVAAGRYQISQTFGLYGGQRETYRSWNVYARLAENVYAEEPVRYSTSTVNAGPGDKVEVYVIACGTGPAASDIAFTPPPPTITVEAVDGNGQRAVALEAAEKPLEVKVTSSDPLITAGASFEVISVPPGATGYSVSGSGVAADGTATAVMVVGDKAGPYVVRVTGNGPGATSISEAIFTTTAVIPTKVAIVKDTADLADLAPAYAVSSSDRTTFYSIGLDEAGQKIGPMKCTWFTSAKGKPATKGQGAILPPVEGVPFCRFEPTKPGKLNLNATSALKGVSDGVADLFVTSLYVSVQNMFDPDAPVDDSAKFVPGMYLDGTNVALDVMETTGQFISLHLVTGDAKGKATFTVDSTNYPGIAMNYPLNGDATEDMQFVNGQQSMTVDFNTTTGDTWTTLLIRDFGASGTVKVSIQSGKTTYALKPLRLPVDGDGNGLPDAGWRVGAELTPVTSTVTFDEDLDTEPFGAGAPFEGTLGDGLTAFEEYRGFLVVDTFQRLDPSIKDLFFVADPETLITPFNGIAVIDTMPQDTHFLNMSEAAMAKHLDPAKNNVRPIINPNRAGIPGASEQRAIRIRMRANAPLFHEDSTGQDYPGHFVALGYTWRDGEDLTTIHELSSIGLSTPNGTLAVDVYPQGFNNFAVHFGQNGASDAIVDPYGDPIVPCVNEMTDVHCVVVDISRQVLRRPYQEPQLFAVASGDDYYTKVGWVDCPLFLPTAAIIMSSTQFRQAHTTVLGHELGHALLLSHQNALCSNIMFTVVFQTELGPIRHTTADVLPLPSNFDNSDIQGMRLHANH